MSRELAIANTSLLSKGFIGKEAASVTQHVISNQGTIRILAYRPSSGAILQTTPGQTTTILGNYAEDMKFIIAELNQPPSLNFGPKPGGFNVLDTPPGTFQNRSQFWAEYNTDWVNNAVMRGDPSYMATPHQGFKVIEEKGKRVVTGFGREYFYFWRMGYRYDPVTGRMIPPGQ